jgi:hypothetical protein
MNKVIPIERAHAKLSASGSEKWMTCTPSARLEEQFADEGSDFAREGTFAHEVFELALKTALRVVPEAEARTQYVKLKLNPFWSQELEDHVKAAVDVVKERIAEARERCNDPVFMIEQRLDFSEWVPEGFGTGDFVIITDGLIEVMDLKYGKGIRVDAENNSQMRLYGLGAYNELSMLYDITEVRMTVLQPRLDNYPTETLPIADLLTWATDKVVPAAKLAWEGQGLFVPGDHCNSCFCKARFQCKARGDAALALAKEEFALGEPELLNDDQIRAVLAKGDQLAKWISDVQSYALEQAEKQGKKWPGFKLVEGRSNRKYSDQEAVAQALLAAKVPESVIYERSLLGITAMEKAIGKKVFAEVLNDFIVKPSGKPTLVPEGDKRPALASAATAAEDFS